MNPCLLSDEALQRRSTSEWISKVKPPQRAASEPDRVSVSDPFPHPLPAALIDFASVCAEAVVPTPAAAVSPWAWSAPIGRDGVTCRPITEDAGSSNLKSSVGLEEFRDAFDHTNSIPTSYGSAASRTSLQNGKTKGYPFQTDGHVGISRPPSETAVLLRRPTKRNWSGSGARKGRRRREEGDPRPLLDHRFKSVSGPSIRVLSNEFVHNQHRSLPNNSDSLLHRRGYFAADPSAACPVLSGSSVYVTPSEAESPSKADQTQSSSSVPVQSAGIYLREQIISFFQPSDNKLAMKLFGSKKALMVETLRQKDAARWIIHPCSNFRLYWDMLMLVLVMANMIILPVAISFFNDDLSTKWIVFNSICDTVFLTDLLVNFRTGYIVDSYTILEPLEIAKHYLKTWFILDFISSIPLDYVIVTISPESNITQLLNAGRALRIFRLVKLLSLLRLLRLSRLVRYINQWQEDIGQLLTVAGRFMKVFNLVFVILLLGHWNGCLQWLVPMLQEFPRDSWAAIEGLQSSYWLDQYTWALFKALSHMLCIGFGRYPPQSTTDVWLTIISMLTGATCYAIFVGQSTTVIQSFDTSKRLYREKFKQVEEYMAYRKLPRRLRRNITNYYEHRYRGKMFDETTILEEVNQCLQEEIVNYNCRALVSAVPFFRQTDHNFVSDVITKLQFEVFLPGDYVIREGTTGTKMYFIQEGVVAVVNKMEEVVTTLSDGSYFGEICLLTDCRRVASVRAETYCSLFSLTVDHFLSVLESYPDMRRTMQMVAEQRRSDFETRNNNNKTNDRS